MRCLGYGRTASACYECGLTDVLGGAWVIPAISGHSSRGEEKGDLIKCARVLLRVPKEGFPWALWALCVAVELTRLNFLRGLLLRPSG